MAAGKWCWKIVAGGTQGTFFIRPGFRNGDEKMHVRAHIHTYTSEIINCENLRKACQCLWKTVFLIKLLRNECTGYSLG